MERAFVDKLASAAPTPGGGGASAYVGALAAACARMVGNLTVGKQRYAEVEGEVRASLERLEALTERLLELVHEDAQAFEPLAAAYRMPKATAQEATAKETALQKALIGATEVPLEIMRTVERVLHEIELMARIGSRMALSDAGVAATFARAAIEGASLNVFINVASMTDTARAETLREEANCLLSDVSVRADKLFDEVKATLS